MDITKYVNDGEIVIKPNDERLLYEGRIGLNEDSEPEFVYACTSVKWRFRGTGAAIVLSSKRFYWDAFAGCMLDGRELAFKLPEDGTVRLELGAGLPDCEHIVTFFKRQDACNNFTIHGIILTKGSRMYDCGETPKRRIEVYGDSVSAGEVSEAVAYTARPDPEGHEGFYSNSRYSYSWITARMLNAAIHNVSQGGIALMPGTGWFGGPDYIGLEQTYDKVKYYPDLEHAVKWDFSKYTPHVVIIAVGQNDAHPEDFMKEDYNGGKAEEWRRRYAAFAARLRAIYPKALIICTTTILGHDSSWDRAIDDAVRSLNDPKITHFLYTGNGSATPGHIRIPEAERMARELTAYINGFGEEIWE